MNSKRLGNIGEAKTLSKFVELGIPVYIPFGDTESADLIAEFGGKLNKIQCKTTSSVKEGSISWMLKSTIVTSSNKFKTHRYTKEEVDYFALYHSIFDILLLVPINVVEGKISISFTYPYKKVKTANNQKDYKDFTFEKVIGE